VEAIVWNITTTRSSGRFLRREVSSLQTSISYARALLPLRYILAIGLPETFPARNSRLVSVHLDEI
jgi:hypothetical protein